MNNEDRWPGKEEDYDRVAEVIQESLTWDWSGVGKKKNN